MLVINWLIQNLESFYYISGILLSSTIIISILQYKSNKNKDRKEEIKNINTATSDLLIDYYQNIIPAFSRLKKSLKGNYFYIDRKDLFQYSSVAKESAQQYLENVSQKLIPDFEELLSFMQSFSVKYELSDCNKSAVEQTVGKSFTDIFEIIIPCLLDNGYDNYNELILTYNSFNLNIQKKLNEKQLNETNKKIEENNVKKKESTIRK